MEDETLLTWVKSGEIAIPESSARLSGKGVRSVTYAAVRIQIAFHPLEDKFEVFNPLITKNVGWIDDVARVFTPDADLFDLTDAYSAKNPDADRKKVGKVLQKLRDDHQQSHWPDRACGRPRHPGGHGDLYAYHSGQLV